MPPLFCRLSSPFSVRSETRRLFVGGGSGGGGGGVDDDVIVVAAVDTCYVRRRTFRQPLYLRNYPNMVGILFGFTLLFRDLFTAVKCTLMCFLKVVFFRVRHRVIHPL